MPCAVDYRYEDQRELQLVTRVACDLAKVLRSTCRYDDLAPETKEWIRRHDVEDAANKAAEEAAKAWVAARRQVIERLDPEARRILGLG